MKPRIGAAPGRLQGTPASSTQRMTGRALQDRRLRLWTANPYCAGCGRLVAYPHGFELDHRVPLYLGGEDTEANCQLLCTADALVPGCHARKTTEDMGRGGSKV